METRERLATCADCWIPSGPIPPKPLNTKIVTRWLEKDVFPRIGRDPISKFTGPMLLDVLKKVEQRGFN
jgi:hypothetical protein